MFRIKRLYTFVLGTFTPLILATFSVCLFIFLMQFLFQHINDMVGKGIDFGVLAQFFFYTSLNFIPLALPLSILLASLMTFGNLGERLELLAMKAAGISLIRIMKPLIIAIIGVAGISFLFQNNILPGAQVKMYTIMASVREKSPEVAIPVGSFYGDIDGYNIYVKGKGKDGVLYDMTVYNYSEGFENLTVIVADSGRLSSSEDKLNLMLTLYSGETFGSFPTEDKRSRNESSFYRRETFSLQRYLIPFDANFNMADSSLYGNRELSKNIPQLVLFIDSVSAKLDSTAIEQLPTFRDYQKTFKSTWYNKFADTILPDSIFEGGVDGFYSRQSLNDKVKYMEEALHKATTAESDYSMTATMQNASQKEIRLHKVKLHEKFSYSLACLLFFFVGAPLGAIIRKGGLGMPAVISVVLYLSYYSIDLFGHKMAKQGVWEVWEGMWLSTFFLAALGIFFTYKAVNDSVMLNSDGWKLFLQRILGKREMRNYQRKDVIMQMPDYPGDIHKMTRWNQEAQSYIDQHKKFPLYFSFWRKGFDSSSLNRLVEPMETWIEDLLNSSENLIVGKLMDYPIIKPFRLERLNNPVVRWACAIIFPVGLTIYIIALLRNKQNISDLQLTQKVNKALTDELKSL